MSTTITTAGGSVGVVSGPADPTRLVLLTLYLHNGGGVTLRLTTEEARRVADALLSCTTPVSRSADLDDFVAIHGRPLTDDEAKHVTPVVARAFSNVLAGVADLLEARSTPSTDMTPCARCGCLATSHPVPPVPTAAPGSVAAEGCSGWQGTLTLRPPGPRDPRAP